MLSYEAIKMEVITFKAHVEVVLKKINTNSSL